MPDVCEERDHGLPNVFQITARRTLGRAVTPEAGAIINFPYWIRKRLCLSLIIRAFWAFTVLLTRDSSNPHNYPTGIPYPNGRKRPYLRAETPEFIGLSYEITTLITTAMPGLSGKPLWALETFRSKNVSVAPPDCEPVHICSAWRLLSCWCWGFQGPSDRRRRDTTFRARRRSFFRPILLCLPTGDGDPPTVAGCAS
jgi:hypothetical protein